MITKSQRLPPAPEIPRSAQAGSFSLWRTAKGDCFTCMFPRSCFQGAPGRQPGCPSSTRATICLSSSSQPGISYQGGGLGQSLCLLQFQTNQKGNPAIDAEYLLLSPSSPKTLQAVLQNPSLNSHMHQEIPVPVTSPKHTTGPNLEASLGPVNLFLWTTASTAAAWL